VHSFSLITILVYLVKVYDTVSMPTSHGSFTVAENRRCVSLQWLAQEIWASVNQRDRAFHFLYWYIAAWLDRIADSWARNSCGRILSSVGLLAGFHIGLTRINQLGLPCGLHTWLLFSNKSEHMWSIARLINRGACPVYLCMESIFQTLSPQKCSGKRHSSMAPGNTCISRWNARLHTIGY